MNIQYDKEPSSDALKALESLELAVADALETKRKLGQYAVVWDGEKPIEIRGDDLSAESRKD